MWGPLDPLVQHQFIELVSDVRDRGGTIFGLVGGRDRVAHAVRTGAPARAALPTDLTDRDLRLCGRRRLGVNVGSEGIGDPEEAAMTDTQQTPPTQDPVRAAARKRIEKRRNLQGGLVAYVVVNAFLVAVWAMTGGGYFWPAWIIAGWGVGMLLGLWDYLRGPVTEADIDDELRRR